MKDRRYVISIDQSTQGTKALLFDAAGKMLCRTDVPHRQIISKEGWVSHNLDEIYENTIQAVKRLITEAGVDRNEIACLGISNQRETAAAWNRLTGKPVADAIVWQCSRSKEICDRLSGSNAEAMIWEKTGIRLSPYFPASKFAWILEHVEEAGRLAQSGALLLGTIDTWLIYKLTGGKSCKTEYSNASRTQLFDVKKLRWDSESCEAFDIPMECLAQVCDSNSIFGETDFDGFLEKPIPITGVLGDSHAALFGHGCVKKGNAKATYGTGSSVMMNVGETPIFSKNGVVTSLAWGIDGKVNYVLEGNINYAGAVISWLKDSLELIAHAGETQRLAYEANAEDETYLVPAFTGLGAPYWSSDARAIFCGMGRTTGKKEIVKAGVECIAYQIADILQLMRQETGLEVEKLCVDGGPTRNQYLMQFQSDIAQTGIQVPDAEELSGIGAAYLAGINMGLYDEKVFENLKYQEYRPEKSDEWVRKKRTGWKNAIQKCIVKEK